MKLIKRFVDLMKVINTNEDFDILISRDEILSICGATYYFKGLEITKVERKRIETIAVNSPITIGNPRKRIVLELGNKGPNSRCGRWVESYSEEDALVLLVHGLRTFIDDPEYNKNPIRDRYDSENKVVIYSTINLPEHIKLYFEHSN